MAVFTAAAVVATFVAANITAIAIGAAILIAAATYILAPKPKPPTGGSDFNSTQTVRQPISPHRVVYGSIRVGGALTYLSNSDDNKYVHSIVTVAGHEVDAINTVYFNDDVIHNDMLTSNIVNAGTYNAKARIKKHLGSASQVADSDLLTDVTEVDSNFRGRGRAYIYTRFEPNQDTYPNGMPNISAYVRGKKLFDPRDSGTRWTPNPALCIRDYLMDTSYGLNVISGKVEDTFVNSAANSCEEIVDTKDSAMTATSVDLVNEWIEFADDNLLLFETGDRITVSSSIDEVPAGLSPGVDYYAVVGHYKSNPAVLFATTYANALAGVTRNLTSAGGGILTVTKTGEPRFTCNGSFNVDAKPVDILRDMLSSMGGRLVYSSGKWRMYAAVWSAPTVTFDEDDLRGQVTVSTRHPRRARFNAIRGIYVAGINNGQPSDYPIITNSIYEDEDGGFQNITSLDLPYTNRSQTAQRLAKIELERHRRQLSTDIGLSLAGLLVQAGENCYLDFASNGFVSKSFEIISWDISIAANNDAPVMGINLGMREIDANAFAFNELTEEVQPDPAPETTLPDAFTVQPPTSLTITSGTSVLDLRLDGSIFSRIKAEWTASTDGFVDRYEIQYKKSADSDWIIAGYVPGGIEYIFILDVKDGVDYDVRVRTVNVLGVRSSFATISNHTVIGKTAVPANVTGFSAQQNGNVVNLKWNRVNEPDIAGYEIRYKSDGAFDWDTAIILTRETKGTLVTNGALPPGAWTVAIKALDTSGNYSTTETTSSIVVTNDNDIIAGVTEHARWVGTLTNLVRHDVSGRLIPQDQDAAAGDNFDVFDTFVQNPYTICTYEGVEVDLGFDADQVRVYAEILTALGPSVLTGSPDPTLSIDYRDDVDAYDGFENWTLGTVDGRHFKFKVTIDTSIGLMYLEEFTTVVDIVERVERGTETVAVAGTAINFTQQFHSIPQINIQVDGTSALIPMKSSVTTTGFTAQVFNSSGTDVGGTVDWTATGA